MSVLRRGEPRASLRSRRASSRGGGDRDMAGTLTPADTQHMAKETDRRSRGALDANIIIANAPDPVFVSDLEGDRKSTRLNSSHITISYAVFCLKKKNTT